MKSFEEIGKELNITPKRVEYTYWNALKKIRKNINSSPELKLKLLKLLSSLEEEGNPLKDTLTQILYDSYGRERY